MKLLNIALLTFRTAVRSRMAISLACVVLLIVFGLPAFLDSDMNPAEAVNVAMFYTLSAVEIVLCVAAVWSGAASFSQDIKNKTFHLIRVKPVALWQAWVGKWLGLVALFASVMLLGFAGMYIRIHMLPGEFPESAYVASRFISPDLPDPSVQVEKIVSVARNEKGEPLQGKELAAYRNAVIMQIPYMTDSISSGQKWNWRFHLSEKIAGNRPLGFRFKFDSDSVSREGIKAKCKVSSPGISDSVTFELSDFTSREIEIPLESGHFEGADVLDLQIVHSGEKGTGSIILQPRQGMFLMQPAALLPVNMLRAYVVAVSVVALVTALGLTLGAFFTLPVAVFCSVAIIATVLISNCTIMGQSDSHSDSAGDKSFIEKAELKFGDFITDSVIFISAPVYRSEPISDLSSFKYIDTADVVRAVGGNFIILPAVFALASALGLRRKELSE